MNKKIEIISTIPKEVGVLWMSVPDYVNGENWYCNNFGFLTNGNINTVDGVFGLLYYGRYISNTYLSLNGDEISFNKIDVSYLEETNGSEIKINLSPVVLLKIKYNKQFDEFEKTFVNTELPELKTEIITKIITNGYNAVILSEFMSNVLKNNKLVPQMNLNNLVFSLQEWFMVYYYNIQKNIDILLKENFKFYLISIFKNSVEVLNNNNHIFYETTVNKKHISLAKKHDISLENSILLLNVFSYDQIDKFLVFLKFFDLCCDSIIKKLVEIKPFIKNIKPIENNDRTICLNIKESLFFNYFVKSYISLGNINCKNSYTKNAVIQASSFIEKYIDYLNMLQNLKNQNIRRNIEDATIYDYYPDDLEIAHNSAIERNNYIMETHILEEHRKNFCEKILLYQEYSYSFENLKIVIPSLPEELVSEGCSLHHCVKTYIPSVASGTSKICFVRKNDLPYMTLEIRNSELVQAKKKFNELPNDDDTKFLKKWALLKDIKILKY